VALTKKGALSGWLLVNTNDPVITKYTIKTEDHTHSKFKYILDFIVDVLI